MKFENLIEYLRSTRGRRGGTFSTKKDRTAIQKRAYVLKVIKAMAEIEIVPDNWKPTPGHKESRESYQLRAYFCKLQPSKLTDLEIDEIYKGLTEMFKSK